ncbi:MAG: GMC family oxidoreductase N-terminal domain-containing protein, partial [Polyangiaceae bacterium]
MKGIAEPITAMRGDYDVVIVGSGYGGAVCASRLARAGKRVCVLERGRELLPGDFPIDAASFARAAQVDFPSGHVGDRSALFRFVLDEDCSATMGCGLGGTSLINAGVALRPDDAEWDDPRWPAALRADRNALLEDGFDRATAMLQPAPYPAVRASGKATPRLAKLEALEAAAEAMGLADSFSRPPLTIAFEAGKSAAGVDQPACALCGDCLTGCNTGAKTTLLTTYLPDAAANGAQLFTELDVQFIEKVDGAYNVHFDPVALKRDRFDAPPMFVRAKVVIVSAGALGSAELLLRSRDRGLSVSAQVGKRFSGNATTLAFGFDHAREVRAVGARGDVGPA